MQVVSQVVAPVTVKAVTITLTVDEVTQIQEALNYRSYYGDYDLSTQFTEALTYKALDSKDPNVVASTGAIDSHIRLTQKIMGIKELRTLTGCGLREAKEAYEKRQRDLNL